MKRLIEALRNSRDEVWSYVIASYLIGYALGVFKFQDLYTWSFVLYFVAITLVFGLLLLIGIVYLPRLKYRPIFDLLLSCIYVLPGAIGYYAATREFPSYEMIYVSVLWVIAMHLFNLTGSLESDKAAGVVTSAVLFGRTISLVVCALFWLIFFGYFIVTKHGMPWSFGLAFYPVVPLALIFHKQIAVKEITQLYVNLNGLVAIGWLWVLLS